MEPRQGVQGIQRVNAKRYEVAQVTGQDRQSITPRRGRNRGIRKSQGTAGGTGLPVHGVPHLQGLLVDADAFQMESDPATGLEPRAETPPHV